ncbi:MAG: polysaccharide biosynthesis/export family protein [Bryobacteraceae bacterium]
MLQKVHIAMNIKARVLLATFCFAIFCQAAQTFASREPRYHLHPGDVINVNYRYTPEYNAIVTIEPDGFVTLPLLGEVKLGGLTVQEVHTAIVSKASERLNNPEVNIDLKDFEKPYYVVGGEVGNPGRFEIRGPITALRAVEIAGGLKGSAKSSQVLLIRPIDDVNAETKLINLKDVINHGDIREDVTLKAGDVLIVPKTRLAKVQPYIQMANPGSYGLYINPTTF